jgi:anti-sigma factor RsiW
MRCEEARQLLSASLDGELGEDRRTDVEAHLRGCARCQEASAAWRHMRRGLTAVGREPVPVDLAPRIRARLATEDATGAAAGRPWWPPAIHTKARRVAAMLIVAGASALAGWQLGRHSSDQLAIEHDVLAAHVRSLLQANPIEVASSSTHSVKPWFTGRIEFAPTVKDLSGEGFALTGGRVEYVGGRRIAALVYKRRLHVINIMMWPADGKERLAPRAVLLRGYNAVTWSSAGMTYWAISDLNSSELAELAAHY